MNLGIHDTWGFHRGSVTRKHSNLLGYTWYTKGSATNFASLFLYRILLQLILLLSTLIC